MLCPHCGFNNHDGVINCLQCGLPVARKIFRPDRFSGIGRRAFAFVIDMIILMIPVLPIGIALGIVDNIWFFLLILFGAYLIYGMILEMTPLQGTLGKRLLGMRVVSSLNGKTLSFKYSFLRNITKLISILALFTGVLVAIFSDDKRCYHDIFGKDYVLPKDSNTKET